MAIDASENVFFAQSTVRVRKMTSAGAITTVAGTQTVESGLGGENVRAAESPVSLLSPGGSPGSPSGSQVAIDGAGNVFFAELENRNGTVTRRIRKVNTAGIVSTIFSNQSPAPATARPEPLPAFRNGGTPAAPSGNFGARAGLGGATTVAPAAPAVAPSGRPTLLETRLGMIPHDPLITVKDCGHAANASMQPVVGACVDEAVRAKAPFIASFDQPGNAPQTVLGLGGTAPDGVVQVQFEGNGGAGGQRVSAGRDCHEPKIETAAGRVQVTCK
jgi:hypothetical protein